MKRICFSIFALIPILSGCSGSSTSPELKLAEIPASSGKTSDTPEQALFNESKRLFGLGLYSVARDSFESLKNSYPAGPYAEFAEIKVADTYLQTAEYDTAAALYVEFLKSHPDSRSVPYVTLMAGRSQHLNFQGIGRDISPLEKALEYYSKFEKNFPDSIYADTALKFKQEVVDQIAENERLVAKYYQDHENELAAQVRLKGVEEKWQPLLTEISDQKSKRDSVRATLVPARLVTSRTLIDDNLAKLASKTAKVETKPTSAEAGKNRVLNVECKTSDPRKIFVYLSSEIKKSEAGALAPTIENSKLVLKLPEVGGSTKKYSCFGIDDLVVSENGLLAIEGLTQIEILSLSNPPRLLIVPS